MPRIVNLPAADGLSGELHERGQRLGRLFARLAPAPQEWLDAAKHHERLETLECKSWPVLEQAWRDCQRWRQSLSDMLATMLAVAASTSQTGNQLHLLVVAAAGSMKTVACDAMLTSRKCIVVEHITGFHSGVVSDDGRDLSFLARANHLTWITPEGDVLVSSPQFGELMAQARRIFDGKSSAVYKNTDDDNSFEGLRTPWIIAGTPALLNTDQSRLGDRFLRIVIDPPEEDERQAILAHVGRVAFDSSVRAVDGQPGTILSVEMARAYRLTGGFVNHLRAEAERLVESVQPSWRGAWRPSRASGTSARTSVGSSARCPWTAPVVARWSSAGS